MSLSHMYDENLCSVFNCFLQGTAKEEARKELWTFSDKFNGEFFKTLRNKEADKAYAEENLGM